MDGEREIRSYALALLVHETQVGLRWRVSLVGGQSVPVKCERQIRGNALAVLVHDTQDCSRRRVALSGCVLQLNERASVVLRHEGAGECHCASPCHGIGRLRECGQNEAQNDETSESGHVHTSASLRDAPETVMRIRTQASNSRQSLKRSSARVCTRACSSLT